MHQFSLFPTKAKTNTLENSANVLVWQQLLELKLSFEPVWPSVGWFVGFIFMLLWALVLTILPLENGIHKGKKYLIVRSIYLGQWISSWNSIISISIELIISTSWKQYCDIRHLFILLYYIHIYNTYSRPQPTARTAPRWTSRRTTSSWTAATAARKLSPSW